MKRLYYILKVFWLPDRRVCGKLPLPVLGLCPRPDFYAVNSAPWYGHLLVNGVLTAVAALAILLVLFLLKRKIKLPEKNKSQSVLRRPQARRTLFE